MSPACRLHARTKPPRLTPLRLVAAAASFSASSLLLTLNSNQLQASGEPSRTPVCLGCRTRRLHRLCCAADASRQPDLLAGQPCQPTAQGAGPVLTPAPPPARAPAHPRTRPNARPPAHPPARPLVRGPSALTTSCACAVWQESLLPYFGSPADLLAADKAMHQGDLAKYGEMVSSWHPRRDGRTCASRVRRGRAGGDRAPPPQRDRAHPHHAGACAQAQRLR